MKARDAAGLESPVVKSAAILVDATPPEGVSCGNFSVEQEKHLTAVFTPTGSLSFSNYAADVTVNVTETGQVLRVEVIADVTDNSVDGHIGVGELKMPIFFHISPQGVTMAQHDFLSPHSGALSVEVFVEAQVRAAITAKVSRCMHTESSSDDAVTLQQMSPNVLSVCSRIRDQESGVKAMMVAVGTTPGGLQVQPWTHVGYSGHLSIGSHVQHATPLWATVVSQNQAGDWSRFTSRPVIWDNTGPLVSEVTLTLRYEGEGETQGNATEVWAEGRWTAEDAESGLESCTCFLGRRFVLLLNDSKLLINKNSLAQERMLGAVCIYVCMFCVCAYVFLYVSGNARACAYTCILI